MKIPNKTTGKEAMVKANDIKILFKQGHYNYDEAKDIILPLLKIAEEDAKKIAKKYSYKAPKFSLVGF